MIHCQPITQACHFGLRVDESCRVTIGAGEEANYGVEVINTTDCRRLFGMKRGAGERERQVSYHRSLGEKFLASLLRFPSIDCYFVILETALSFQRNSQLHKAQNALLPHPSVWFAQRGKPNYDFVRLQEHACYQIEPCNCFASPWLSFLPWHAVSSKLGSTRVKRLPH